MNYLTLILATFLLTSGAALRLTKREVSALDCFNVTHGSLVHYVIHLSINPRFTSGDEKGSIIVLFLHPDCFQQCFSTLTLLRLARLYFCHVLLSILSFANLEPRMPRQSGLIFSVAIHQTLSHMTDYEGGRKQFKKR